LVNAVNKYKGVVIFNPKHFFVKTCAGSRFESKYFYPQHDPIYKKTISIKMISIRKSNSSFLVSFWFLFDFFSVSFQLNFQSKNY